MADLISRAAARDVINTWGRQKSEKVRMGLLHRDLDAIPSVDAVHVVRCRDCMYFRPWRHDRGEDSRCEFWNTEMGAEDYCSQAIYLNNGRNDDGKAD